MNGLQPGDIVERTYVGDGNVKIHGRYVVDFIKGTAIKLKHCSGEWLPDRFILIARGVGSELSQFINEGSQ